MGSVAIIQALLGADRLRLKALELVAELDLPDCWIAAGFVRDAVWDHLHDYPVGEPQGNVDVVWFCKDPQDLDGDRQMERRLFAKIPTLQWSLKNQARMHLRNADDPYQSVADAMRYWPETATAIAARIGEAGEIEINAPPGLEDLITLQLRPGPRFHKEKLPIFLERVSSKSWTARYPKLETAVSASDVHSLSN